MEAASAPSAPSVPTPPSVSTPPSASPSAPSAPSASSAHSDASAQPLTENEQIAEDKKAPLDTSASKTKKADLQKPREQLPFSFWVAPWTFWFPENCLRPPPKHPRLHPYLGPVLLPLAPAWFCWGLHQWHPGFPAKKWWIIKACKSALFKFLGISTWNSCRIIFICCIVTCTPSKHKATGSTTGSPALTQPMGPTPGLSKTGLVGTMTQSCKSQMWNHSSKLLSGFMTYTLVPSSNCWTCSLQASMPNSAACTTFTRIPKLFWASTVPGLPARMVAQAFSRQAGWRVESQKVNSHSVAASMGNKLAALGDGHFCDTPCFSIIFWKEPGSLWLLGAIFALIGCL